MSQAIIKIDVDRGCVFVTINGIGEAYVIAEDFVKVIKETQTDVFEGKHTFVIN